MTNQYQIDYFPKTNYIDKWLVLITLLLVSVINILVTQKLERFNIVIDQILIDQKYEKGTQHWQPNGIFSGTFSHERVILQNNGLQDNGVIQYISLDNFDIPLYARMSIIGETHNIRTGKERYAGASSTIVFYDENQHWISQSPTLHLFESSKSETYSQTIAIPSNAKSMSVTIRLLRASGLFIAHNPRLSLLAESPLYRLSWIGIVLIWACTFFSVSYILFTRLAFAHSFGICLSALILLFSIIAPTEWIQFLSENLSIFTDSIYVKQLLTILYATNQQSTSVDFSDFQHLIGFLLIGGLLSCYFYSRGLFFAVWTVIVLAISTESIQTLTDHRTANIDDIILDISGGFFGILIGTILFFIVSSIKRKLPNNDSLLPPMKADEHEF
jgi:VanZ family protein